MSLGKIIMAKKQIRTEKEMNKLEQLNPILSFLTIDYKTSKNVINYFLRNFLNIEMSGSENIPADGGAIYICNHTDNIDPLVMACECPRKVTALAKAELFELYRSIMKVFDKVVPDTDINARIYFREVVYRLARVISSYVRTQFLEWGAIPIVRNFHGNSKKASVLYFQDVENDLARVVRDGNILVIFPEGTRTRDQKMAEFKPMAARIAIRTQLPVIPSAMSGSHGFSKIKNILSLRSFRAPVKFKVGRLLHPPKYSKKTIKKDARILTKQMEEAVRTLMENP
jgi:1-acyl-sn-glycerol-3-phosphate acyltransferase